MCDRETANTIIERPALYQLKQTGSMLSKQLHSVFVKYLKEDRRRAPNEAQLQDLVDSFQDGAKHDRKALQNKFKSWAKRMELREPDKALILSSTKKMILPIEEFESTIMALHFSSETHLTIDRVVTEIKKSYTWSRRDFGMDWEIVTKVISRRCNKATCLQKLQHRFPCRPICVFAPKEDAADNCMKSGVSQHRLPYVAPNLTPESATCRPANANTSEAETTECQQPRFVVNPIFKAPESFFSFLTPNVHSKIFGKEAETTTNTCGVQLPVSYLSQRLFNACSAYRNLAGADCAPRGVTSGSSTPVPPILPLRAINQQLAGRAASDYCHLFHHPTVERLKSPTENQIRKSFSSSESVAVDNLTSPEKLGDATLRSQNQLTEEKMREYLSAMLPLNATLGNSITCGSQTPGTFTCVITPIEYQKHRNQTIEHLVGGERASKFSESKIPLPVAGDKSNSEISKQLACSESTRPPNFTSMHKFDICFVGDPKGSAKPKAPTSLSLKTPIDAKELTSRPTTALHARKKKESKKRLIGQEKKDFIKGGEVSKDLKVLKVGDGSVTLTAVSGDKKKTSVKSSSKVEKSENPMKIGNGSVTLTKIHGNDANVENSKTDIKPDGIKNLRGKSRRKSTPQRRKNVEDKTVKSIYSNFFQKAVIKASSSPTSKASSSSSKSKTLPSPHNTRPSQKRSAAVAFQNDASASNVAFQNDASASNVAFQNDASASNVAFQNDASAPNVAFQKDASAAAAKDVPRHSKQANKKIEEPKVSETSLSSPISFPIKNDLITQLANMINKMPQTGASLKANASGLGSTQIITNKGMKMTSICNANERQLKFILPPVNVSGNRTLSTSTTVSEKGAKQVTLPPSTLFIIRPMQQPNKTVYGPNQFADSKPRVNIPQQLQKIAKKDPANSVGCNVTKSNSVNSSLGNEKMPNNRNNKSEKIKLCTMRKKIKSKLMKNSKNKQSEAVNKKAERATSTAKSQHSERPTHLDSSDDLFDSFLHKIHAMKKNILPTVANMGRGKYADMLKSQIDRCYRMVKEMKMDHDFSQYEED